VNTFFFNAFKLKESSFGSELPEFVEHWLSANRIEGLSEVHKATIKPLFCCVTYFWMQVESVNMWSLFLAFLQKPMPSGSLCLDSSMTGMSEDAVVEYV
jgi:hypothetical protein